jgi:DNA-binding transcriptional regulator GbsR (MarR family)
MNTSRIADPLAAAFGTPGRRFIMHWGEMGSRWGVNRTVAQLHALLFLAGRPMHAEDLADILQVARSNISNSLRELQNWGLVRVVHLQSDRRDHYETAADPWELMRIIVRERKAREFDPTIEVLQECIADPAFGRQDSGTQKRMRDTLVLMETVSDWTEQMLRLETPTLARLAKLGAKVQSLVRGKKAA